MGVAYEQTAIYTCDQTGVQVIVESDTLAGAPEGWLSLGSLWFSGWGALRDYAAARAEESTAT